MTQRKKQGMKVVMNEGKRLLGQFESLLPVKLDDKALLVRGQELAKLAGDLATKELEFEGIKKKWKAEIEALETRRSELSQVIRAKEEDQPVSVEAWAFYDEGAYREIRKDTGETISERRLHPHERQQEINLGNTEPEPLPSAHAADPDNPFEHL